MPIFIILCFLVLFCFAPAANAQETSADQDYALGLVEFKKGDFAAAVEHFKSSLAKDPNPPDRCERRLHLGHAYAGMKELGMAVKTYRSIEADCHGSPEEKLAVQCIKDLMKPSVARAINANLPPPSGKSLAQDIRILDVQSDLPAIDPTFISMVKSTVSGVKPEYYEILDKGGCNVTVAQNIVDKWPNAYNISTPGQEHVRLSQDYGFTQGLDIYVWERPIYVGNVLGKPFPIENSKWYLRIQLYRVVCHILGIDKDKEYLSQYQKDLAALTKEQKENWLCSFFLEQKVAGPAQLAGCIVESYESKEINPIFQDMFPNSHEWLKKRLKL